jgi:hypothetical protein
MWNILVVLILHSLLITASVIDEQALLTPDAASTLENIAFFNLGTYRKLSSNILDINYYFYYLLKLGGFADNGTEYHKTYFLSRISLDTWGASRSFCKSYNMELLTLETQTESQAVLNLLDTNNYLKTIHFPMWADLMTLTLKSKTEWFWTSTGNKISFPIPWFGTEPNNNSGNEYCIFIEKPSISGKFGFADGDCNVNRYSLCHKLDFVVPHKN